MEEKNYFEKVQEIAVDIESKTRVREYFDNKERLMGYWNIGRLIYEAQGGEARAKYGNGLIKEWSEKLVKECGKNYGITNLKYMRQFYIYFEKGQSLIGQLTWTHYLSLLPIKNENERNYYINQVILNNLSVRELKEEIKNKSYERLSYADKNNIKLIELDKDKNQLTIEDMIKDPILIKSKELTITDEKSLHRAIIEMLEKKFLELGTGFTLAGHEYKITIDNKTYKIDLLFFNTELNCYVVVELKVREVKPQDIGQLEFYVQAVDKTLKRIYQNKTIGILIVKKKNKLVLEYIINRNLYLTTYKITT